VSVQPIEIVLQCVVTSMYFSTVHVNKLIPVLMSYILYALLLQF